MKINELTTLLANVAAQYVSEDEARYFAEQVVETSIRKSAIEKYNKNIIKDVHSWNDAVGMVEKRIDLPGYTQFDFNGRGPSLKIKEIHDELEHKARANGIAMISVVNSGGMHVMHLWTQGLAQRGLFTLGGWNGGPDAVTPHNGTKGVLGTNPLTYGFPGDKGDVVIDMATSEIPYFKIVDAKKNGTTLPPNTAVTDDGEVTTDPNEAFDADEVSNLLPMGGNNYKGYNINYLLEVMTSALIGAQTSSEMSDAYIEKEHGGFIIAIAIDKVTDKAQYDTSITALNEDIRSQKSRKGVDRVQVPGDRNLERKVAFDMDGDVDISEDFIAELELLIRS